MFVQIFIDNIAENIILIYPSIITAEQLYEALANSNRLLADDERSVITVDEFYISVPNTSLDSVELSESGGFTYEYKYGRSPGNFELEYVKRVPMSGENLSKTVQKSISENMPEVWKRLVDFNRNSPGTNDISEEYKLQ